MLVLARQRDQSVIIDRRVEVKVVDIRGDKVRLGFVAPEEVEVDRKEVFEQKQLKLKTAATQVISPQEREAMDPFLRAAIDEAKKGLSEGGLPIGSVLVRAGQIIGRGHNRRVQHGDPMAHAEIDCLTNAGRQKTYRDTVLYTTLMPCLMCAGAIAQFGVPKIVVGDTVNFAGGQCKNANATQLLRDCGVEVLDLHDQECIEIMAKFVRERPELWREDHGE